jgi:hypothetical protein
VGLVRFWHDMVSSSEDTDKNTECIDPRQEKHNCTSLGQIPWVFLFDSDAGICVSILQRNAADAPNRTL